MFTIAILFALHSQVSAQAPPAVGSLVGCASDAAMQHIPGVIIVARSGPVRVTTTTGAGGCYELRDLPTGSYRVTARVPGFDNETRDGVAIVPDGVAHVDFAMRISPMCECTGVGGTTLTDQWDHADAVLHVRLSAGSQSTTPAGYYRHVAMVLDALKKPRVALKAPVFVLQNQRSGAPEPYDVDQELVMFLRVVRDWEGFAIVNDEPGLAVPGGSETSGPAVVFLMQDGHIQHAPPGFSRYVGLSREVFLNELRALARARH